MIVLQFRIRKMIPSTSIPIQQRRRLDGLFAVLTSLTLKSVVSFAKSALVKLEKLSESVERKMTFSVFFLVDDRGGQRLLVGLPLEDLLFDCPG